MWNLYILVAVVCLISFCCLTRYLVGIDVRLKAAGLQISSPQRISLGALMLLFALAALFAHVYLFSSLFALAFFK